MANDWNELAARFTRASIDIDGVYKHVLPADKHCSELRGRPGSGSFFLFTLRGEAELYAQGACFELHPGKTVHLSNKTSVDLCTRSMDFEYCAVYYSNRDDKSRDKSLAETPFPIETGTNARLVDLLRKLHHTAGIPGPAAAFRSKELFYSILQELINGNRLKEDRENRSMMEQAIQFIRDRYGEPFTLNDLASLHGMRTKEFSRLFQQYAGVKPTDFLVQRRIKRAEELLATTGCSISEAAQSVGYADLAVFVKQFKQHAGFSPDVFAIPRPAG
ncbi:helix-turn-helix domain-containing protein [Cohnella algarum]|uniref:helix-turn-helix domain-containing protein n=1 Tax=Cohnella algarum TaxID=2044859 RepID=UPI001966E458|nr:AraC family transcriptional regulator [Cohnella algarum]MBN2984197.1 helix-turn-helix transcriptional regulator [Cohnella algarum]